MLEELRISDFAVVEDAVIAFGPGLNVLTGSTGAGKSIILTAVELLSGRRARRSYIRSGSDCLTVEGVFRLPPGSPLRESFGIDAGEDQLSIRREVMASGRSRTWINGRLSTASAAAEATSALIELHGQHQQQELLDPASHVRFLDGAGDHRDLLKRCASLTARFREEWTGLRRLLDDERTSREREDFLRYQLRELEGLGLEPGIAGSLERSIRRIEHVNRYRSALAEASDAIQGEEGAALDSLGRAERALRAIADLDERWAAAAEEIAEMRIRLSETARGIDRDGAGDDDERDDIETLQSRLANIQRASRKYHTDPDGLAAERDRIRGLLGDLDGGSGRIADQRALLDAARADLIPVLESLSVARAKTAKSLDRAVTAELEELGIRGALFRTSLGRRQISAFLEGSDTLDLSDGGWDEVEFLIRTNVGENLHPLAETASGGELSRVTLVLRKLLAQEKRVPALVFDEIDAGLGADLGSVVAAKLFELSQRYQVICITHLPQIAAGAGRHIAVRKDVRAGRTRTTATVLDEAGRTAELTRMLGGPGDLRERLAAQMREQKDTRP